MNAAQQVKLGELYRAADGHGTQERYSPAGVTVSCDCGWSIRVPRQNALARNSKIHKAIKLHLEDVIRRKVGELK